MINLKMALLCACVALILLTVLVKSNAHGNTLEEEFNGKVFTPPPVLTSYGFKEDKWTGWNKFFLASYVGANIADVATTQAAFDRGCVEGNPLMPESTGAMIAVKVLAGSFIYYATEKWFVPAYGTQSRNYVYGIGSVLFGAVSVSNNSCGR